MNESDPFLVLERSCEEAVEWVARQIRSVGLEVLQTFDLHIARKVQVACPCPHHGTDNCDCQMIVLLIYGNSRQPVSIVAHGHNGRTWFSVVDTPQQRADPGLKATIHQVTLSQNNPLLNHGSETISHDPIY